jgi:hypothetical protein
MESQREERIRQDMQNASPWLRDGSVPFDYSNYTPNIDDVARGG